MGSRTLAAPASSSREVGGRTLGTARQPLGLPRGPLALNRGRQPALPSPDGGSFAGALSFEAE